MQKCSLFIVFALCGAIASADETEFTFTNHQFEVALQDHDQARISEYLAERAGKLSTDGAFRSLAIAAENDNHDVVRQIYEQNKKQILLGDESQLLQLLYYALAAGVKNAVEEVLAINPRLIYMREDHIDMPIQSLFPDEETSQHETEDFDYNMSAEQAEILFYLIGFDRNLIGAEEKDHGSPYEQAFERFTKGDDVEKLIRLYPEKMKGILGRSELNLLQAAILYHGGELKLIQDLVEMLPDELSSVDGNGKNILFYGALYGSYDVFDYLLGKRPDLLKRTAPYEQTLVDAFIDSVYRHVDPKTKETDERFTQTLLMLIEKFPESLRMPDPKIVAKSPSASSLSPFPLQRLAKLGAFRSPATITKLIEMAPETLNAVNYAGETPLFLAAESGNLDTFKVLLAKNPANLRKPSKRGDYPIHAAISRKQTSIFNEILAYDPSQSELRGNEGTTLMHAVGHTSSPIGPIFWYLHEKHPEQLLMPDEKGKLPYEYDAKTMFEATFAQAKKQKVVLVKDLAQLETLVYDRSVLISQARLKEMPHILDEIAADPDAFIDRLMSNALKYFNSTDTGNDGINFFFDQILRTMPSLLEKIQSRGEFLGLKDFDKWDISKKRLMISFYKIPEVWAALKTKKEFLAHYAKHQPAIPIFGYYPAPAGIGFDDIENYGASVVLDTYRDFLYRASNPHRESEMVVEFVKKNWEEFFNVLEKSGLRADAINDPAWTPYQFIILLENYLHVLNYASDMDAPHLLKYDVDQAIRVYRLLITELADRMAQEQIGNIELDVSEASVLDVLNAQLEKAAPLKKREVQTLIDDLKSRPAFEDSIDRGSQSEYVQKMKLYLGVSLATVEEDIKKRRDEIDALKAADAKETAAKPAAEKDAAPDGNEPKEN